jgi:hypothetical protein
MMLQDSDSKKAVEREECARCDFDKLFASDSYIAIGYVRTCKQTDTGNIGPIKGRK